MKNSNFSYWCGSDGLLLLSAWAREGLDENSIAARCGVSPATLKQWKKRSPEIALALSRSQQVYDLEVEDALHRLAVGFKCREERIKENKSGTETTTIVKDVPPSVSAISMWLKNRCPELWCEKPDIVEAESLRKLDEILDEL